MGTMEVTRHFIRTGEREVHYRRAGSGPPFVLFHVSPQSSAFVIPHFLPLADNYTLIALDSPGYGNSDPLPLTAPTMADYADAVLETLDALGISRAPVFGSHTGANIAVELARRSPERVAALVLDGLSLNTSDEAQERTANYATQFVPTADGAHLAWAWQHTRDQLLFWPWYKPHKANRLHIDMKSAEYIHDVVLAKMTAANYWLGYRAAFSHDSSDALRQLIVETHFVTPDADVHTAVERGLTDLPSNIHFIDTTQEGQIDAIRNVLAITDSDASIKEPPEPSQRQKLYQTYVSTDAGQRLVRLGGQNMGRPLVLLHGSMGTSSLLANRATTLATDRPVLALDIAGNGDSDPLRQSDPDLGTFAEDVRAVLNNFGLESFDVYGESVGATLAIEIARQDDRRTRKLILDRPEFPAAGMRGDLVANVAPIIEASWDGSHLLTAWHMLRDTSLFWPWYRHTKEAVRNIEPDIEPVALQSRLLAWLKGGKTYGEYMRASLGTNIEPALMKLKRPCLVIGTKGDILESHADRIANELTKAKLVLADRQQPPTSVMIEFLDS